MKILIVNTFYYPNMQGGAEQSVKLLAEGLVKRGHDVAIYCVDSKDGKSEDVLFNDVKVFRRTSHNFNLYEFSYEKKKMNKLKKIKQKLLCYYNYKCAQDFEKICIDFKPDIVHTNTTYGISPLIWKKAYKLKIPIVHTIRDIGIISPVQYGHKVNWLIKRAHLSYMKKMTKFVTGVTAPSSYTLTTTLKEKCFKKAKINKVIFNSVDIDYEKMNNIISQKLQRNNEIIKYMYAGRLIYFKGIEHMINSFEMIDNENCELHICGTGEMQKYVEDCSTKNAKIIYHGKLNNVELANCYEQCDVLLVPSYWPEPFGRVLIEGNMYGLPVIAGDCGGMPEIIEHTNGGLLY